MNRLGRVSHRVLSEIYAWVGTEENLPYQVVFVLDGLPAGWESRVAPRESVKIAVALRRGRKLRIFYLHNALSPSDNLYVLTIDRDRKRVDCDLSSQDVLTDSWEQEILFSRAEGFDHPNIVDIVLALETLALLPFWKPYRQMFLARQKVVARVHGFSRRFASLVLCLSRQIDSSLRIELDASLRELWRYEQEERCPINFEQAKCLLRKCNLSIIPRHESELKLYGHGPLIETYKWTKSDGEEVAVAYVYARDVKTRATDRDVRVRVRASYFQGDQALALLDCHAEKSLKEFHAPIVQEINA